ncbi:hypothetical protein GMRT_14253 [Giardia muris]|uniref:Uncharacterized protein n=1 Tax=Giardia muris TaxID=5742 RepID=A0A4Z1SWV2_GIAMU|nr:hypothetical protein GMRT_14253 [Giardia muris]|eukprot:TNJ30206.1 hypothetical protein GMRT_14253 [Giardia muris]
MVRNEAEEEPVQRELSCCQRCAVCLCALPKVTFGFIILISLLEICFFFSCISESLFTLCSILPIVLLTPSMIVDNYCLWQFITAPFISQSLLQTVYAGIMLFYSMGPVEKLLGWQKLILFGVIEMVISTLIAFCFAAFFYYTPGVNNIDYFALHWNLPVGGPLSLTIFFQIISLRMLGATHLPYCCCTIPAWAYVVIVCICCQVLMFLPWCYPYYVLTGVAAGYCIPRRFITIPDDYSASDVIVAPSNAGAQERYRQRELVPREQRDQDEDAHIEATLVHEFRGDSRRL